MEQKEQKEQKKQKDNTIKVAKEPSLYADIGGFKGFSFQNNIDSINKLYFGQGLVISKAPYIYRNEKDGKYYLSAYCFKIDGKNPKEIYYPEAFLNLVFYHDQKIYFVNSQNELLVYKIDEKSCKKYKFAPQYRNSKETNTDPLKVSDAISVDLNEVRLKQISDKLIELSQNADVKSEYEFLCDVIKNDFKESLMEKSKQIRETISFIIKKDDMNFTCEISKDSKEIDSVGNWRKKISVNEGEISFQAGILSLMKYVGFKDKNEDAIKDIIANDFKCPVLFKNFKENIIPENKTMMCEIKAGFAVKDVINQLEDRIKFIKNCLFNKGEKPEYFIGIVNLFSENVQKLSEFYNYNPKFDGKVILISVVDYEYHGINISYEINNEYLLLNKVDKLEKEMKNSFKELNLKFDFLLKKLDKLVPGFDSQEYNQNQKKPVEEEKKNDIV